ncbi:MAG: pyridoxal-dependent decarboxylase [Gemmatimonadales bacterium]|jgi:aromatic-L-amino-acid decarboxylase
MSRTLEPTGTEFRVAVQAATDRIAAYIDTLSHQPAHDSEGVAELARSLVESAPEHGKPLEDVLDLLFDRAVHKGLNAAGPGYLAYIPGGGLPHAALAGFIAEAVNRYVGVWLAAPALVQLESNVIRWFCDMVGYPRGSLGILTTGGSLANFSAIVTARRERLPPNFLRGTIYVSDQVHHSVNKAAMLAGFPDENLRVIESDDRFRMRIDVLERHIAADRAEGYAPFLVVGSAGTVNTGAVDDLRAIAALAAQQELWFHIDAAYGGFFVLTDRGRQALAGIDLADSVTLDPHKGLFMPYGLGSLLVRDGPALARAHASHGAYMPAMQDDPDFVDFCQISPELSRGNRGLRVWLPFQLAGVRAFRQLLDEKLDLACWAADRLRTIDGIEIVAKPVLSIVAFRLTQPGLGREDVNALNRALLGGINRRKRVYITGTTVRGEFFLRLCVLSFRTHVERMEMCLEDVRQARAELG